VFTVHAKHYLACVYLLFVFKAWMGFAWQGCTNSTENRTELWERPAPLDGIDYGEPVGLCTEVEAGVFVREWTRSTTTMDCNRFIGIVTLK
jgi:hypothetical protein